MPIVKVFLQLPNGDISSARFISVLANDSFGAQRQRYAEKLGINESLGSFDIFQTDLDSYGRRIQKLLDDDSLESIGVSSGLAAVLVAREGSLPVSSLPTVSRPLSDSNFIQKLSSLNINRKSQSPSVSGINNRRYLKGIGTPNSTLSTSDLIDPKLLDDARIVFLLGSPGSDFRLVSSAIEERFGLVRLSIPVIDTRTSVAASLDEETEISRVVIYQILAHKQASGAKSFLLESFPSSLSQHKEFVQALGRDCDICILTVDSVAQTEDRKLLQSWYSTMDPVLSMFVSNKLLRQIDVHAGVPNTLEITRQAMADAGFEESRPPCFVWGISYVWRRLLTSGPREDSPSKQDCVSIRSLTVGRRLRHVLEKLGLSGSCDPEELCREMDPESSGVVLRPTFTRHLIKLMSNVSNQMNGRIDLEKSVCRLFFGYLMESVGMILSDSMTFEIFCRSESEIGSFLGLPCNTWSNVELLWRMIAENRDTITVLEFENLYSAYLESVGCVRCDDNLDFIALNPPPLSPMPSRAYSTVINSIPSKSDIVEACLALDDAILSYKSRSEDSKPPFSHILHGVVSRISLFQNYEQYPIARLTQVSSMYTDDSRIVSIVAETVERLHNAGCRENEQKLIDDVEVIKHHYVVSPKSTSDVPNSTENDASKADILEACLGLEDAIVSFKTRGDNSKHPLSQIIFEVVSKIPLFKSYEHVPISRLAHVSCAYLDDARIAASVAATEARLVSIGFCEIRPKWMDEVDSLRKCFNREERCRRVVTYFVNRARSDPTRNRMTADEVVSAFESILLPLNVPMQNITEAIKLCCSNSIVTVEIVLDLLLKEFKNSLKYNNNLVPSKDSLLKIYVGLPARVVVLTEAMEILLIQIFNQLDINKDNVLSINEHRDFQLAVASLHRQRGSKEFSHAEIDNLFSVMDTNADCVVDLNEFLEFNAKFAVDKGCSSIVDIVGMMFVSKLSRYGHGKGHVMFEDESRSHLSTIVSRNTDCSVGSSTTCIDMSAVDASLNIRNIRHAASKLQSVCQLIEFCENSDSANTVQLLCNYVNEKLELCNSLTSLTLARFIGLPRPARRHDSATEGFEFSLLGYQRILELCAALRTGFSLNDCQSLIDECDNIAVTDFCLWQ